jgi:nicotinate phosphoribosyltransferase
MRIKAFMKKTFYLGRSGESIYPDRLMAGEPWLQKKDLGLFTDLYELTMMQSYRHHGMNETAVFELFVRDLPENWNFLLACGQDELAELLSQLSFPPDALDYLKSLNLFTADFLDYLRNFRFSCDVFTVPEGTLIFPYEPILTIRGPLLEAQLVETLVMNQIHYPTLAASKAARVVLAAQGKTIVDFGVRRIHGLDAGLKAARSFYLAGVDATSNVLAGKVYGIPLSGTMAHSFIQAFDSEEEAFEHFARTYPEAVLLVDTYHSLKGVQRVIELSRRLGPKFRVRGVRLDSGDLGELAEKTRLLLDEADLSRLTIFASGGLDEYDVARLVEEGYPIDGFGVGTKMGVAADQPFLDMSYKLVEYRGTPRLKLSAKKETLPGRKQVFRREKENQILSDELALENEVRDGIPLLERRLRDGRPVGKRTPLIEVRRYVAASLEKFPDELKKISGAKAVFPVDFSPGLKKMRQEVRQQLERNS